MRVNHGQSGTACLRPRLPAPGKLCILFHRFGPYHWARLEAAAQFGPVCGIELSATSSEYAWDKLEGHGRFERMTLFEHDRVAPKKLVSRVRVALEQCNPTAVAIPGWSKPAAVAALIWCWDTGTPAVLMSESNHFDERRCWWKEQIKRAVVLGCGAGLVGGTAHAEYLSTLGLPPGRIFNGYNVVDNAWFSNGACRAREDASTSRRQLGLPEKYFLASKRFVAKKNIRTLLEAYALYRAQAGDRAWELVLLGDGPLKPHVLEVCGQLGIARHVVLPGFIQYAELPAYYGLARVFIHASTVEQWGLVVNEAMAARLPVLVSNRCGCARELVHEGKNGFTFEPLEAQALCRLMLKTSFGECNLAEMGKASCEIITAFSPKQFGAGIHRAMHCALGLPKHRPSIYGRLVLQALIHRRN